MSEPVQFPGANRLLKAPHGAENVSDLPVFANGTCCVSAWQLSEDELAAIVAGKRVYLAVFAGRTQPPVFVGSEDSVREVVADYGVWKR